MFTVTWICAIETELVAVKQFPEKTHDDPDQLPAEDDNAYSINKVDKHDIGITILPRGQYRLVTAAVVTQDMTHSFRNLRFALMMGTGGVAPSPKHDYSVVVPVLTVFASLLRPLKRTRQTAASIQAWHPSTVALIYGSPESI